MWSFEYPDHLLHKVTEKEWFPRSNDHSESRLDSLEREEEARRNRMKNIAKAKVRPPIGLKSNKDKAPGGGTTTTAATTTPNAVADATTNNNVSQLQDDDDYVYEPRVGPRIWNNLSSSEAETTTHPAATPTTTRSDAQSSMMLDDSDESSSLAESSRGMPSPSCLSPLSPMT